MVEFVNNADKHKKEKRAQRHHWKPKKAKGRGDEPEASAQKSSDRPSSEKKRQHKEETPRRKQKAAPRQKQQPEEQQRKKQPDEQRAPEQKKQKQAWNPDVFNVPKKEGATRFHDFDIPEPIMHAIYDLGFEYCTPIQANILPETLKGKDAAGQAQTGTGKTAAFLISMFTHFLKNPLDDKRRRATPRALVIAPTRELAKQIELEARDIGKYTGCRSVVLYGGERYDKQHKQLTDGYVDLVVATPGRLLDFRGRRHLHLGHIEILVIDEADRMLDMGFIPDVRRIIHSTPPREQRQTMLFSATLSPDVHRLASQWMNDPVKVEVEPEQVAVESVDQKVYIVTSDQKISLLYNLMRQRKPERVLVFANRRDTVARIHGTLRGLGFNCGMLSGSMTQKDREKTLKAFREGDVKVVAATDVAGRGLHVEGIDLVVNYNIPHDAEDYVHRIGRTGRAGAKGESVSFACEEDSFYIPAVEEFMGEKLDCERPPEEWLKEPPAGKKRSGRRRRRGSKGSRLR